MEQSRRLRRSGVSVLRLLQMQRRRKKRRRGPARFPTGSDDAQALIQQQGACRNLVTRRQRIQVITESRGTNLRPALLEPVRSKKNEWQAEARKTGGRSTRATAEFSSRILLVLRLSIQQFKLAVKSARLFIPMWEVGRLQFHSDNRLTTYCYTKYEG